MTKRKKKSLTRQVLAGVMAAGMLWGGFAAQAEASSGDNKSTAWATEGGTEACNQSSNEFGDYTPSSAGNKYLTVGYVPAGINANANGNVMNLEETCNFSDYSVGDNLYKFKIYGGFVSVSAAGGNANSNRVNVNGGHYNIWELNGGFSSTGNADSNKVYINDGNFGSNAYIYGGQAANIAAGASENLVEISDGIFNSGIFIYGGTAHITANKNAVNIKGGTFTNINDIYGGRTSQKNASVNENTVNISGGNITKSTKIIGGETLAGKEAKSNKVIIRGGNVTTEQIFGGYISTSDTEAVAEANTVEITGGTVKIDYIYGGDTTGIAKGNSITIGSGAEVKRNIQSDIRIYGGSADKTGGRAEGNIVTIGTDLANAYIYGGCANQASTDNQVIIKSGNITGSIKAGYSGSAGTVSGNKLVLEGGTIESSDISGGYSSSGEATGNIVELRGAKVIGTVQGGSTYTGNAHDNIIKVYAGDLSGALLNSDKIEIHGKGLNIQHITDFNQLDFYIPKDAVNGDTLVTITGYDGTYLANGTKINAGVMTGSGLGKDDKIILLKDEMGITNDGAVTGKLTDAGFLNYDLTIATSADAKSLIATIGSASGLSADSKSIAETRAGGIAILNDGATLMAGTSLINAKAAAHAANLSAQGGEGAPAPAGFTPFAAVGANNMRYNTGSHVDSKGWGINVGMARELTYKKSVLTIAPLIEYGRSSYDSYLDSGTHGSGKQQFLGVGAIVRQDFTKGTYVEGSLRAGRMKGDYNSGDLNASYDTASNYLGLHLGVGKILKLDKKNKLDIYGKLFYTKQGSDDVTLSTGAVYNLESIDSFRTRLGARWTAELAKNSNLYVGLAWDHEFDSNARATYKGFSTPTPSMKGDSGLLELGWQVKPKETSPLSINLNLTGWCGKQKGVQFGAGFEWGF